MQLVPPSIIEPVAAELDAGLWKVFEASVGFPVPQGEEEGGLVLSVPAIPTLDGYSFQQWALRSQSVSMVGASEAWKTVVAQPT